MEVSAGGVEHIQSISRSTLDYHNMYGHKLILDCDTIPATGCISIRRGGMFT